jgi:uncharacterized protein YxjI
MVFRSRSRASSIPAATTPDRQPSCGPRYRMIRNLTLLIDSFVIQTDEGNEAFVIERTTRQNVEMLTLRDMQHSVRYVIPFDPSPAHLPLDVVGKDGKRVARVTSTPVTPVRDRFSVQIATGGIWEATGEIGNSEYRLTSGEAEIAEVSQRWFLRPGTFGVEVASGSDDALVLAVTAVIDQLAHGIDPA